MFLIKYLVLDSEDGAVKRYCNNSDDMDVKLDDKVFQIGFIACCSVQMVTQYVLAASPGFTIGVPPADMN